MFEGNTKCKRKVSKEEGSLDSLLHTDINGILHIHCVFNMLGFLTLVSELFFSNLYFLSFVHKLLFIDSFITALPTSPPILASPDTSTSSGKEMPLE